MSVISLNSEQCKAAEALLAQHAFGYRWFVYRSLGNPPWCCLQVPSGYQKRHGGVQVDHPVPGDEIDTDVPAYLLHCDTLHLLIEKCLEMDSERPVVFHKCLDGGYCVGDIQRDHYETTQQAMGMHLIRVLKLEKLFQENCAETKGPC